MWISGWCVYVHLQVFNIKGIAFAMALSAPSQFALFVCFPLVGKSYRENGKPGQDRSTQTAQWAGRRRRLISLCNAGSTE